MDPWCSVSFLIHSFCFQTWKFTFKEHFKANQECKGIPQKLAWDLFSYLGFVTINFMAAKRNIIC